MNCAALYMKRITTDFDTFLNRLLGNKKLRNITQPLVERRPPQLKLMNYAPSFKNIWYVSPSRELF
jgi:hypothetical protein